MKKVEEHLWKRFADRIKKEDHGICTLLYTVARLLAPRYIYHVQYVSEKQHTLKAN